MSTYDAIVLGTGGVGSAACWQLARRGARVLGLDRFPAGHDRGSSHGETRIIRQAYFEHADYVPLLRRAYELWGELEEKVDDKLFSQVGLLQIGPREGAVVSGVLQAAELHSLDVELLTATESERRFSGFRVPAEMHAVYERRAGLLYVERCVQAHCAAAIDCGAELRSGVNVLSWQDSAAGVTVRTDQGEFSAAKLIVTAGPWAGDFLRAINVPLIVRRKHIYWLPTAQPEYQAAHGAPAYLYELPHGVFYGLPAINERGLKCGEHSGGQVVTDPLHEARLLDPADQDRVLTFARDYLPGVSLTPAHRSVCFYTMSPDENFLLDRHPQAEHVFFAAGLSGHGFKFTGVLGEVLADWALTERTKLPVEFLSLARFH
ncbi:Monomeric sarcosine oxidase [Anatilimnocola aggregata]|uniref:Monomeric sarcosine oxidase n=1 Tax=Anatilimnocola aggregata TaxID=2528021 RepID=A0A517YN23_9BACT|nr:N-methyl-L-tryptophan oxidase [Anatilimnocola aggregata]QDU31612.1 Monomeric sarcosine oxidase [Anatilimnocola aggregata]